MCSFVDILNYKKKENRVLSLGFLLLDKCIVHHPSISLQMPYILIFHPAFVQSSCPHLHPPGFCDYNLIKRTQQKVLIGISSGAFAISELSECYNTPCFTLLSISSV